MKLRIIRKNILSIQQYSFSEKRFYGLRSSQRPSDSAGVNTEKTKSHDRSILTAKFYSKSS